MIDLHCHILPGVDDGAKTMEESVEMAKLAASEGITHILATPHHMNRSWFNEKQDVIKLVNQLQSELDRQEIAMTIFPGQEIRLYGDIIKDIEEDKILFTDEQQQYILIEFPTATIPTYAERLFFDLQSSGKIPIIVHPERNHEILKHPNHLKDFIDKGALAQLTAASYTGGFGSKIQKFSKQLIEANLVHFLASDAHNVTNRAFHMQDAYDRLSKEYGTNKLGEFHKVTKDLINGELVVAPTPKEVKQSFLSKWFK
ncbi:protein-tyrosine phosphatase [Alkalibacterium subtropicum]|uniref:Tyrosine-protein phosphatase n=1 Tax=Alkalibacterium subtropicum TaxID=753702 RepID=A0A1I1GGG6_9LACT|nr:CpsB/CapC family capsule biosynthesis tyrosine phosphatase [Alkalibacterium subtropicum]SFC10887.1 protein-tyrosine phosphatase [Alkalibacterium subtropicum]